MDDCPNCAYHRKRAQRWREEAYKQSGYPLPKREQEPVQVSPLEFVEMVMEKEHLVGKPIFWAEWPNKEKNNG